jgi:epoxyqueuosine reductase
MPHIHLRRPRLKDFAALDDASFRQVFSGSPVKRLGRDRFVRNVLIAIGNSGDVSLGDSALALLEDASPLVRAMAVWALARLLTTEAFETLREEFAHVDPDPDVKGEWAAG